MCWPTMFPTPFVRYGSLRAECSVSTKSRTTDDAEREGGTILSEYETYVVSSRA